MGGMLALVPMYALAAAFGATSLLCLAIFVALTKTDDLSKLGVLVWLASLFGCVWAGYAAGHFAGLWL